MDDNEYKVQIEQFEGPLDLLLHLIGKARIDIEEIFVSKVTGQYLAYVSSIQYLPLDRASEFIEMAAILVYIKSRMILPSDDGDDELEEDPEQELISRLKTYKTFKEAAEAMRAFEECALCAYYKLPEEVFDERVELEEMSLQSLYEAYAEAMARIPDTEPEHIEEVEIRHDIFTIKERAKHILRAVNEFGSATFFSLFSDARSRLEVAVTFIALLELIHENVVSIRQSDFYEDIHITKVSEEMAG
ncbi:MAG: segregation/condensation protein A [Eubacteriales bacterium]|nr:segregation/condensation protein A [Eubacteriales bacterium]